MKLKTTVFVMLLLLSFIPTTIAEDDPPGPPPQPPGSITHFGVHPDWTYFDGSLSFFMKYTNTDNDTVNHSYIYIDSTPYEMWENDKTNTSTGKNYSFVNDFTFERKTYEFYFEVIANNSTTLSGIKTFNIVNRQPYLLETPPVKIYVDVLYEWWGRAFDPDLDKLHWYLNTSITGNQVHEFEHEKDGERYHIKIKCKESFSEWLNITVWESYGGMDYWNWTLICYAPYEERGEPIFPRSGAGTPSPLTVISDGSTRSDDPPTPLADDPPKVLLTTSFIPNGEGHELDYTPKGGGDHYVEVDDAIGSPDDDSTYVSKNSGNQEDYWTLVDSIESGTITNVRLHLRVKHDTGGEEFAYALYTAASGEWISSDVADSTSWTTYTTDLAQSPLTSLDWTWPEIDALQLGIKTRAIGGWGGVQYCTSGYIIVTYTAANDPPVIDDPITEEYWTYNIAMAHQWNSTDSDVEPHTWSMGGDPGYLTLQYGYRTAWINGTCTDSGKSHPIYLNVTDGKDSDQEIFTLFCTNVAPTIDDKIDEEYWTTGVAMAHQWNSTDPDLQSNTWSMGGDPGYLTLDQGYRTAFINGTCNDAGKSHPIYLNVSDGADSDQETFTLYCVAVPPTTDYFWFGHVDNDWDVAANWEPTSALDYPKDEDDRAFIDDEIRADLTLQDGVNVILTIGYLQINATYTGTMTSLVDLVLDSSGLYNGSIAADGGTWDISDEDVNIDGDCYFGSTTITNPARFTFQGGVTQNLESSGETLYQVTVDNVASTILYLKDDAEFFDLTILSAAVFEIDAVSESANLELSFTDSANCGFISSSSGTLLTQGDVTYSVTITTADAVPPPTNYWIGTPYATTQMKLDLDYTTLSYGRDMAFRDTATSISSITDVTITNFASAGSNALYARDTQATTTITDLAITSSGGARAFQIAIAVSGSFVINNLVISSFTGADDIYIFWSDSPKVLELIDSNFDATNVNLGGSAHTNAWISQTHNDVTNNYKLGCQNGYSFLKSSISNDFSGADNVELLSGQFTIDIDADNTNFWAQSNTVVTQNSGTIWTITGNANFTINGTVESSGIITYSGAQWFSFFINYNAYLYLNTSTVINSDIVISFPFTVGANNYGAVNELNVTQPLGADNNLNITQRDFSVKGSGTVLTFISNNSANVNTHYTVTNLTTGLAYNVNINGTTVYTIRATGSQISFSYTSEGDRIIEISYNNPPAIGSCTLIQSANESGHYSYVCTATDIDGDSLTWSMDTDGYFLHLLDENTSATIYGTPDQGSAGDYYIHLSVTDGTDTTYCNYSLEVFPEIDPLSPITVYTHTEYDMWQNKITITVDWIQVGGRENGTETGKWAIITIDGTEIGSYQVDGILTIDAPWSWFDGNDHVIGVTGVVNVDFTNWGHNQTYYSGEETLNISNSPRSSMVAVILLIIVAFFVIFVVSSLKKAKKLRARKEMTIDEVD